MKTYFPTNELYHLWAHQRAPIGKCSSHVSFEGKNFYSYSTIIATIIDRVNKGRVYLFNETKYSVTTSCHQSSVIQAIPNGVKIFRVGGLRTGRELETMTGKDIFEYSMKMASQARVQMERARSHKGRRLEEYEQWITQAKDVVNFFGLRRKVDDSLVKRLADRLKTEKSRAAKIHKSAQRKAEAGNKNRIERWLAGLPVEFPSEVERVHLRINGADVETSKGARVPISAGKAAYHFAVKRKKEGWHRNGEVRPIGNYQLDSVNEHGIIAGCHRITWEELMRFAEAQGWDSTT